MRPDREPQDLGPALAVGMGVLALVTCCVLPAVAGSAAVGLIFGTVAHAVGAGTSWALGVFIAVGGAVFGIWRLRASRRER